MPDRFGVPDNMFGPMPEDFYSAVGRVVLIAALLEVKLVDLLNTLDRVPQTTHARQAWRRTRQVRAEVP